jgi:hypothetical protein
LAPRGERAVDRADEGGNIAAVTFAFVCMAICAICFIAGAYLAGH